jgi:hypothetical protein
LRKFRFLRFKNGPNLSAIQAGWAGEEYSMKTSSTTSWWREMGAISRGMMFIQGHIATPATLETIQKPEPGSAAPPAATGSPSKPDPRRSRISRNLRVKASRVLHNLEFLGGRPMHAGHNDDLDEPFPQPRNRAVPRRESHGSGEGRPGGKLQADNCATC